MYSKLCVSFAAKSIRKKYKAKTINQLLDQHNNFSTLLNCFWAIWCITTAINSDPELKMFGCWTNQLL